MGDSNGIFLISFHSVDSAIAFTEDVAGQITDLTFTCGVHIGVPTSVAANKASGRADYLGPPVNATARLMALAGDKKDMIGGSSSRRERGGGEFCLQQQGHPHTARGQVQHEGCLRGHDRLWPRLLSEFLFRSDRLEPNSQHSRWATLLANRKMFLVELHLCHFKINDNARPYYLVRKIDSLFT